MKMPLARFILNNYGSLSLVCNSCVFSFCTISIHSHNCISEDGFENELMTNKLGFLVCDDQNCNFAMQKFEWLKTQLGLPSFFFSLILSPALCNSVYSFPYRRQPPTLLLISPKFQLQNQQFKNQSVLRTIIEVLHLRSSDGRVENKRL